MKKYYSLLFVLFVSTLFISSCKKNNPGLGIYTCNIVSGNDTTAWSATRETIAMHAGIPLNIIGRDDSTTLIINLNGANDPGVYEIMDSTASYINYVEGPGVWDVYKNLYGSSGTVTISEINSKRVKGTFDTLVLSNSFVKKTLINGAFDIELQ